jgi:hypothetical protein
MSRIFQTRFLGSSETIVDFWLLYLYHSIDKTMRMQLCVHSKKHGLQIFTTETQKTQNVVINILTIAYIYFIFREFCAFVVKLTFLEWTQLCVLQKKLD